MADTTKILNCPACGKEMTKIFMASEGVNLDVCLDGCGGILFDNRELKKFDEQSENIDELKQAMQEKNFEKTDENQIRICPVCGANMVKNSVSVKGDVIIDECYSCGAKFFDHGELTKMREEYPTEEDRRQALLTETYNEIGAKIDDLELKNNMNLAKRSKFLKAMDKLFYKDVS